MKSSFRRLLCFLATLTALIAGLPAEELPIPSEPKPPQGLKLRVAAVQLRSGRDIRANVARIRMFLAECAARKVVIAAFPECALSSYSKDAIESLTDTQITEAEREVAAACGEHGVAAVIGTPERRQGRWFNTALIINARGEIIGRYDKAHLADWDVHWKCVPGDAPPPVFPIGPTQASLFICHDSRYPELCRLPVIAGARIVFYLSAEAFLYKESKMGPYRAQVQARAVENTVFLVHANPPADGIMAGSHGQSRIVAPDGNILQEATQIQEEMLVADLNLAEATGERALRSLEGTLGDMWRAALPQVRILK